MGAPAGTNLVSTGVGGNNCSTAGAAGRTASQFKEATSLTGLDAISLADFPVMIEGGGISALPQRGWSYGTTEQYPGHTFVSYNNRNGDDMIQMGERSTCTIRPFNTGTDAAPVFVLCADTVDANSFHPACRANPMGCP